MRLKNVRRRREFIQQSVLDDRIEALKRWDNFREQKQMAINCIVAVREMQQRCFSFSVIGKSCCFLIKIKKKVLEVKAQRAKQRLIQHNRKFIQKCLAFFIKKHALNNTANMQLFKRISQIQAELIHPVMRKQSNRLVTEFLLSVLQRLKLKEEIIKTAKLFHKMQINT